MSKKVAFLGLSLAVALIFGYVEMLIQFDIGIPGVKIGLANIVVMVLLYTESFKTTVFINFLRIVIVGALFGGGTRTLISFCGAVFALSAMWCLKKLKFHIITVSAFAGVMHNFGQTAAAIFVMGTGAVLYYLPMLIVTGLVSGSLIGVISNALIKRIKAITK